MPVNWTTSDAQPGGSVAGLAWSPILDLFAAAAPSGIANGSGVVGASSVVTSPNGTSWTDRGDPFTTAGADPALTDSSEPTWPTVNNIEYVPDGDYLVQRTGTQWTWAALSTPTPAVGESVTYLIRAGRLWVNFDGNTTGASEPTWSGSPVTDGSALWHDGGAVLGTWMATTDFGDGGYILAATGHPNDIFFLGRAFHTGYPSAACWSPELGIFVIAGGSQIYDENQIVTSDDGAAWTPQGLAFPGLGVIQLEQVYGICWSPESGLFVAVGYQETDDYTAILNTIVTSPDAETWTVQGEPFGGSFPSGFCVCWSPELSLFVAGGYGDTAIVTSPDGSTWTPQTSTFDGGGYVYGICWSPELTLFVAVGYDVDGTNCVMTSPDGEVWTPRGNPLGGAGNGTGYAVAWSPELSVFMLVGYDGDTGENAIATSPDGIVWTNATNPFTSSGYAYSVVWVPELNRFLVGGYGGGEEITAALGEFEPPPPPPPPPPQTLYAARGGNAVSELYTLDSYTGDATDIGPIGFAVTGLAVNPVSGVLYGIASNSSPGGTAKKLIVIDTETGEGTGIGPGLDDPVSDICFSPDGLTLYGWGATATGLYVINTTTGTSFSLSEEDNSGGGIDFVGETFWRIPLGTGGALQNINRFTGAVTDLSNFDDDEAVGANIGAAAYSTALETMFICDSNSNLYTVDLDTGEVTLIAQVFTSGKPLDALAWSPVSLAEGFPVSGRFIWAGISAEVDPDSFKSLMVSDDGGETWAAVDSPFDGGSPSGFSRTALGLTRFADRVVAVGADVDSAATVQAAISDDFGSTWEADPTLPFPTAGSYPWGVFAADDLDKIVIINGQSSDPPISVGAPSGGAFAYASKASPFDGFWAFRGCYSPFLSRMVVVGVNPNNVAYSDDGGETWTAGDVLFAGSEVRDICWIEELGLFVAVGGDNVATSPDGITWDESSSGTLDTFQCVAWSRDQTRLAVGTYNGDVYVTDDPTLPMSEWARVSTTFTGGIQGIAYGGGRWLLAGLAPDTGQCVAWSPDALSWNVATSPYDGTSPSPNGFYALHFPEPAADVVYSGIAIAFNSRTLDGTPTYIRIDDGDRQDVEEFSVDRGRESILNRCEAGTAGLKLKNNQGTYDPTNEDSDFAGDIRPLLPILIAPPHPITGDFTPVFTGFIEEYRFSRRGRHLSDADVNCVDLFDPLSNAQVVPNGSRGAASAYYAAQRVNDRIIALAADAGVDPVATDIFAGNVNVQESRYSPGTSFLTALFDAADAEFPGVSNLYIARDGTLRFRGRKDRFEFENYDTDHIGPTVDWPRRRGRQYWSLGDADAIDAPGGDDLIPIFDLTWNYGKNSIINTALVTPMGVADLAIPGQRVLNAASRSQYGERAVEIPNLIILDHPSAGTTALEECHRYARYYVDNWKEPSWQIESIEVHGHMAGLDLSRSHYWDFCLQVELGDVVYITTYHPTGGGFVAEGYFVEGIHHRVTPLNDRYPRWVTTLDLSPISAFASFPDPPS